jgi:DGQHR domain-containing protein
MPTPFRYPCLVSRQRPGDNVPVFCIFHAEVGQVLQWSAIRRLQDVPGAPQRKESPAKVNAVRRFLTQDARNTIPTAVIITLNMPVTSIKRVDTGADGWDPATGIGRLDFELPDNVDDAHKPGLVVDGQHRLLGMNKHDPTIHVNVIGLLNANDMETAFQFLVINHKASKVPTDHIRALSLQYVEEDLTVRLRTARLTLDPNLSSVNLIDKDDASPFYRIISWPTNPENQRIVSPSAIEASVAYIQQKKVKQFQESEDILLEYFNAVWGTIKDRWPDLWNRESRLLSKVGILCMTEYITDALVSSFDWGRLDIGDPEQVRTMVEELLAHQDKRFWTIPWVASSYDTKAGRSMLVSSLVQVARNRRADDPWYTDITILDLAAYGGSLD